MNAFEHELGQARARRRRLYLLSLVGLAILGLLLGAALLSTTGTAVRVEPPEAAEAAIVEVEDGMAVTIGGVVYGLSRAPTVIVRAEGFREGRRTITRAESGGTVTVTLVELPGRIIVSTRPSGPETRWEIDGTPVGVGESLDMPLEPGRHRLRIDHPYFAPAERELEIARAETQHLSLALEPVAARLAISVEGEGGRISIDGRPLGEAPVATEIAGGRHTVRVERVDHAPLEDVVEVTNRMPSVDRHYRLQPLTGTLTVRVSPPGGRMLLDGRQVEPAAPHLLAVTGEHSLTYLLPGYRAASRTVRLAAGEEKTVTLDLEPALGEVEIHAAPAAGIFIDGAKVGVGTVTLDLKARPHLLALRKPGYRSIEMTLTPRDGRRTVIRETLLTEHAARQAEAPQEYRNTAGIVLRLFQPGAFVMGAPRHQVGQRANEFERQVVLQKAFYAGKHEVTNDQYRAFRPQHSGPADEPVTNVSWLEAAAFCNWLSTAEGLTPFYAIADGALAGVDPQADGYRLLTEAEWEWLARRAGKQAETIFPWGDRTIVPRGAGNIADEAANGLAPVFVANYHDGYGGPAPVGQFPAEASGLFDLTGNVSEWVHDLYSVQPPARRFAQADPVGPEDGFGHVVKGSSWRSGTRTALRAAYREGLEDRRDDVGFRIGRYLYGRESQATR